MLPTLPSVKDLRVWLRRPTPRQDLTRSPRTVLLAYEPASTCNLRCVYCSLSQPDYRGKVAKVDVAELVQWLRERQCHVVQINGHGETTALPGWHRWAGTLLDHGFQVNLLSNFARTFSPEEIGVAARLGLSVSIDTVDPDLYRRIRRGGDVRTVLTNVLRVNAERRRLGRDSHYTWNCVLCEEVLETLPELARVGIELGVNSFVFCPLVEFTETPGFTGVTSVSDLPAERRERARRWLQETVAIFDQANVRYSFAPVEAGDQVTAVLDGTTNSVHAVPLPDLTATQPYQATPTRRHFLPVPPGMTRDCLDPWNKVFVHADRKVGLCCKMPTFGNLNEQLLSTVVDSEPARRYREGLLTGKLTEECRTCSIRGCISTKDLRRKVERSISGATEISN